MTELVITPPVDGTRRFSLILAVADRERELAGYTNGDGIYLMGLKLPSVVPTDKLSPSEDGPRRFGSSIENAPEGEANLRVVGDSDSAFWDAVDDLEDLVMEASRAAAKRQPATLRYSAPGNRAITFDLQTIAITGIPQDRSIGIHRCLPTIAFTTSAYGRLDPVEVVTGQELDGPLGELEVVVPGHVEAFAELTLHNEAPEADDLDHVEVGVERDGYDPADPAPLTIDELVSDGFAGTPDVEDGWPVVSAVLSNAPAAICSTGPQPHVGRKRISARCFATGPDVYVRLVWRVGSGPWHRDSTWRALPDEDKFFEVWLETKTIPELEGGHSWEGVIEAYSPSGFPTVKVHWVETMPAESWSAVRAPKQLSLPSGGLIAYDSLTTADGTRDHGDSLIGSSSESGDVWSEAGDGDDIQIFDVNAARLADSDASIDDGQFARLGVEDPAAVQLSGEVFMPVASGFALEDVRAAYFVRYQDPDNCLLAAFGWRRINPAWTETKISLIRVLGGAPGVLAQTVARLASNQWRRIEVAVDEDGNVTLVEGPAGGHGERVLQVSDAELATGGDLESGGFGIYDANASSADVLRAYRSLAVSTPLTSTFQTDHVLWNGRGGRFSSDRFLHDNADGTSEGELVIDGEHLRLPPSTRTERKVRVAIKTRLHDLETERSRGLDGGGVTADLSITERVALL